MNDHPRQAEEGEGIPNPITRFGIRPRSFLPVVLFPVFCGCHAGKLLEMLVKVAFVAHADQLMKRRQHHVFFAQNALRLLDAQAGAPFPEGDLFMLGEVAVQKAFGGSQFFCNLVGIGIHLDELLFCDPFFQSRVQLFLPARHRLGTDFLFRFGYGLFLQPLFLLGIDNEDCLDAVIDHASGYVNVIDRVGADKQVEGDAQIGYDTEKQRRDADSQRAVEAAAYPAHAPLLVLVVVGLKMLHAQLVVLAESERVEGYLRDVSHYGHSEQEREQAGKVELRHKKEHSGSRDDAQLRRHAAAMDAG